MAKYFFDSGDSNSVFEDEIGVECTGIEGARRAGIEGLKDLAKDELRDIDGQQLFVEVRDENGEKLLRLSICLQVKSME
ncbi:hypothetical protein NKH57_17075 [Mesorhizobium sp. M1050]